MPRGEFKHRNWFFADAPNIAGNYSVIWKDLLWTADSYRLLKYRGGWTIALFELNVWCEKCVAARHYAVICKQLLISNDRNRGRWVVLGLSEDGACTDLFENLSVNSLKRGLSNGTTFNPPHFSLVNTFKMRFYMYVSLFEYLQNFLVKNSTMFKCDEEVVFWICHRTNRLVVALFYIHYLSSVLLASFWWSFSKCPCTVKGQW